MRALREAERVRLWRHLGCVSMMEYLERVFGYSPRVAQERMRTARKLEELPELAQALAEYELPFSAVRELSRIATPATEATWRAATRGKSLREIEEMVSGLAEGDLPTNRKKPELQTSRLSYEGVLPATRARERQLRQLIDSERGERLDDGAFIAAVFELALGAMSGVTGQGVGDRAKYQIVIYHCKSCGAAKQLGAGVQFDLSAEDVERAQCDAERVSAESPGRVTQDIPKKVRRFVELRDGKRCRIPGCRSSMCLELHHIVHIEDGGTHDPENILTTCEGHHGAHHRGVLWISGTSTNLIVRRADERMSAHVGAAVVDTQPHRAPGEGAVEPVGIVGVAETVEVVDAVGVAEQRPENRSKACASISRFEQVANRTTACRALVTLGWKPKIAGAAVDAAMAELGPHLPLDPLIRAALQRCK